MYFSTAVLTTLATAVLAADTSYSPLRPPSVPLAVRGPYTNVWSTTKDGNSIETNGVNQWTDRKVGWTGIIEVDGKAYQFMGHDDDDEPAPVDKTKPSKIDIDSQWSNFTYSVDGVDLTASFFSPVAPKDTCRQSIPLSYLQVAVSSGDNKKVKLYGDIDSRWNAPNDDQNVQFAISKQDNLHTFDMYLENQIEFGEDQDTSLYGNMTFTTDKGGAESLSYQSGAASDLRKGFVKNGLNNKVSSDDFGSFNGSTPVVAYVHDFGDVSDEKQVLYTVGTIQDPGIQFNTTSGYEKLTPWWKKCYKDTRNMIKFHFKDFESAGAEGAQWESQLKKDISEYYGAESDLTNPGKNEQDSYYAITALSARQVMGAYSFMVRPDSANHTDLPYAFQKEIASNGNMNTIDVVFPATPFFVYSNIDIMRWQNDAVFQSQELFAEDYTLHDIGAHYPNATGHFTKDDMENMPLEECGNIIVMSRIYNQLSEDDDYLKEHYHWLSQYTNYLIEYSEFPADQLSTDDFSGQLANQTNLAMKGIVGIAAMSEIADIVGDKDNSKKWKDDADRIYNSWKTRAVATRESDGKNYTLLAYNDDDSWGMLYNAYPAFLLDLNVGDSLIEDSKKWADSLKAHKDKWGIPLDSRHHWTKTDWQMWMAAYANADLRAELITNLANFLQNTSNGPPFSDLYDTETGNYANGIQFKARPVVGGHFALLANLKYGKKINKD